MNAFEADGYFIRQNIENLPDEVFPEITPESAKNFAHRVASQAALAVVGPDVYFSKRKRFEEQQEYRFIWNVTHEVADTVEIYCPDARQYCEWKNDWMLTNR